jgi:hypothetical protein
MERRRADPGELHAASWTCAQLSVPWSSAAEAPVPAARRARYSRRTLTRGSAPTVAVGRARVHATRTVVDPARATETYRAAAAEPLTHHSVGRGRGARDAVEEGRREGDKRRVEERRGNQEGKPPAEMTTREKRETPAQKKEKGKRKIRDRFRAAHRTGTGTPRARSRPHFRTACAACDPRAAERCGRPLCVVDRADAPDETPAARCARWPPTRASAHRRGVRPVLTDSPVRGSRLS